MRSHPTPRPQVAFLIFIVYTVTPLGWLSARNVSGEDTGTEEMRYQEALEKPDLNVAKYQMFDGAVMRSRRKSADEDEDTAYVGTGGVASIGAAEIAMM